MYKYGLMVNTHMTFEWNKLGVHRPDEAVKILSQFNSEMAKWLRVGKPRESIQRMGRRQGRSAEHFYVFAHENGGKHGLHTHQICFVPPPATINAFRVWAWKRLGTLAKSFDPQNGALDITAWKTTTEDQEVKRGWSAFRYIIKQLTPYAGIYDNDRIVSARDIFRPWPIHQLRPIELTNRGFEIREGQAARKELQNHEELERLLATIKFDVETPC